MNKARFLALHLLSAGCLLAPGISWSADSPALLVQGDTQTSPAGGQPGLRLSAGPQAKPVTVPGQAAVTGSGPDEVELAALYYYAKEKQEGRVEAEAARLRVKYPAFILPADLYAPVQARVVDEQPLWQLYEKDDFAGVDAAIQHLQAATPGWIPSQDFTDKLARRKLRVGMTNAYQGKDWLAVIAAARPLDAASETDVDLLWMLIDGYREAEMKEALLDVYKGILFRDGDRRLPDDVLVTTLQKATRDFSDEDVRGVMQTLWTTPALVAALQPISNDMLRRDVGAFNADAARTQPLPQKDIDRLRQLAETGQATADLSLLGWYALKLKQPKEAEHFFADALAKEPAPALAKGLYLSLAQQGEDAAAYKVAVEHLQAFSDDATFVLNALSIRFGKPELGEVDRAITDAYSAAILKTRSAPHAEILGWYAYNVGQFASAEAWFAKSMEWEQAPERLKGLALSVQRQNRRGDLKALRDQYAELYPEVWADIKIPAGNRGKVRKSTAIATPEDAGGSRGGTKSKAQIAAQWR